MLNCLAVGAGGFVGAVLRYLVSMIPLDKTGAFPVNTLLINILGAFAIGAITALGAKTAGLDPRLTLLLKTGICGGFTTFSTFALETAGLMQSGYRHLGGVYAAERDAVRRRGASGRSGSVMGE